MLGDKDTLTKEYMSRKPEFADSFNFLLYDGEQRIKPEELTELDTATIALPYGADRATFPEQKARDVLKVWQAMTDGHAAYCLLGLENQAKQHLALPVRNALYDAITLAGQVQAAAKSHKKAHDKATPEEYLSGFHEDDYLMPVITLVMYWEAKPWTARLSLSEMYAPNTPVALRRLAMDYKVNLIAPLALSDGDLHKFQSSLREVMGLIKYSGDREASARILQENPRYRSMDVLAAQVVDKFTGLDLMIGAGEESVDMCKAWEDQKEEGRNEGRNEGRELTVLNRLLRFARRQTQPTEQDIIDMAEDSELSVERVQEIAQQNGIAL